MKKVRVEEVVGMTLANRTYLSGKKTPVKFTRRTLRIVPFVTKEKNIAEAETLAAGKKLSTSFHTGH